MAELPVALPAAERTVGQLIAESIRSYGQEFWHCLPLGLPLALADQLNIQRSWQEQPLVFLLLTPLFVAAYLWACEVVLDVRPTRVAALVAFVVWIPFPLLRAFWILPGLAWLALVGLAVPAAMVGASGFRDALVRGRQLALAGYARTLGALCALVVVVGVSSQALAALLNSESDTAARLALFLSDVLLSPLLFLGSALLYRDQAARLELRSAGGRAPR